MKKIDRLLLTSSFGPFMVAFGIALFVLVMQFLWLYIDEIAGKGVSIFIMVELISYLSVATFPMALPIAVLISSVMVMGNLAERYELSSMKSAGVSLLRVMRTLIFAAAGVALFSYVCSDFLIPEANLKFKSRLYDIRKQKPALTIEQGVFNEDFRQFVIRVGEKEKDDETIKNVMIEDQSRGGTVRFNQILADSGQMFTTADKHYFVMNLFDGVQYQEPQQQGPNQKQKYPFIRTHFKSWTKVWDLKEFEMNRTDEDRFRTQRSMLSMEQLRMVMDSLNGMMEDGKLQMADDLLVNLKRMPVKTDLKATVPAPPMPKTDGTTEQPDPEALKALQRAQEERNARMQQDLKVVTYRQDLTKPLTEYDQFLETFPATDREKIRKDAENRAKSGVTAVNTRKLQIENRLKEAVKTGYELYIKYSYALVCLIFLFIGAPMGAIIRKGGFGYPILVSIIFFVAFVMSSIVCKRLAELYILTPFWSAMVPCLILVPIAAILTVRAMNDSKMINTDRYQMLYRWILRIIKMKTEKA